MPGAFAAGRDRPDLEQPAHGEDQSARAYRLPAEPRSMPGRIPDERRSLPDTPAGERRSLPRRRSYDEPDTGRDVLRSAGDSGGSSLRPSSALPDWEPAAERDDRELGERRRSRRGTWRPARHGGRATGDHAAAEPAPPWPGSAEALEPLPQPDGPGRRHSGRSAWRPSQEPGERRGGDDDAWADQRWSAPLPDYDADYEPEYGGDSW